MEEKIKNTIIFFVAVVVFIIISVSYMGINQEPNKKADLKKETPIQPQQSTQKTPQQLPDSQPTNAISGVDSITTTNYANQILSYFYYIPVNVALNKQQRHPYLILVSGLGSRGEDFTTQVFKDFANQNGFIILAPSFTFDQKNWQGKTSYQYPAAWSGRALNDILNSFMAKQGLKPSRIYMLGFSAGAQFALRYALLYPDYVTACSIIAAGEVDMPMTYQATKFLIAIGDQDEQDRKQKAIDFYNAATAQKIDIYYKEYKNIAHQLSDEEINDSFSMFSKINEAGDK